ncbi:hypothetical protein LLUC147_13900 (plasmid) [Lactococcus cremoris]
MLTSTAEPPHEMISMKLPAELFRETRKTRIKKTGNCLFCLLGVWGKRPILAKNFAKAFRRNRQTDGSVAKFSDKSILV